MFLFTEDTWHFNNKNIEAYYENEISLKTDDFRHISLLVVSSWPDFYAVFRRRRFCEPSLVGVTLTRVRKKPAHTDAARERRDNINS